MLAGDVVRTERVPGQRADDGIHRYLARGPLAALRVIDLRQPRDQRFETCLGSGWHGVYRAALAVRDNVFRSTVFLDT